MTKQRDRFREWLKTRTEPFTAKEVGKELGVNNHRATAVLVALLERGEVTRGEKLQPKKMGLRGERLWVPIALVVASPGPSAPAPSCRSS